MCLCPFQEIFAWNRKTWQPQHLLGTSTLAKNQTAPKTEPSASKVRNTETKTPYATWKQPLERLNFKPSRLNITLLNTWRVWTLKTTRNLEIHGDSAVPSTYPESRWPILFNLERIFLYYWPKLNYATIYVGKKCKNNVCGWTDADFFATVYLDIARPKSPNRIISLWQRCQRHWFTWSLAFHLLFLLKNLIYSPHYFTLWWLEIPYTHLIEDLMWTYSRISVCKTR